MYFLGLTFHPNYVQFKKIDLFRRTYDDHYRVCKTLQMSLLPPFSIGSKKKLSPLVEDLSDAVDSFYLGVDAPSSINFSSIGIIEKKRPFIYLRPELPGDIHHLQDMVHEVCQSHEVNFKPRGKNLYETFLPIAKPRSPHDLLPCIREAKENFVFPLELFTGQLCLFEKLPGQWIIKEVIHQFNLSNQVVDDDLYGNVHQGQAV